MQWLIEEGHTLTLSAGESGRVREAGYVSAPAIVVSYSSRCRWCLPHDDSAGMLIIYPRSIRRADQ